MEKDWCSDTMARGKVCYSIMLPYAIGDNLSHRCHLLALSAREIEFRAFIMSVTDEGYATRIKWKMSAIQSLHNEMVWSDEDPDNEAIEDAREIAIIIRRIVGTNKQ